MKPTTSNQRLGIFLAGRFLSYVGATAVFALLGLGVASLLRTVSIASGEGLDLR